MLTLYPSDQRGRTDIGWLQSRHTFSFGEWYDPTKINFRALRVINDDVVGPKSGFDTHGHRDMEIVTVVLSGELTHADSLGHKEALVPGEVQAMSAGRGIKHSEFNEGSEPVHLLQIWLMPTQHGTEPRYAQKAFPPADRLGRLQRVVAGREPGRDGALEIGQDAALWLGTFRAGDRAEHALAAGRAAFVHVATGSARVNGQALGAGDAIALERESSVVIEGHAKGGEVLLFDLA